MSLSPVAARSRVPGLPPARAPDRSRWWWPLPHSGSLYPSEFLAQAAVSLAALRRAEDAFVDELFAAAPGLGIPLLAARFPRSYVDANREPYELDPGMFEGPLPRGLNHRTTRVAAGLGMIPRVAASGEAIYRGRVPAEEIERRLETCWRPYHLALSMLVEQTYAQFGGALLIDAHSMPSSASGIGLREREQRVDVVLGDNHGEACAPGLIDCVERWLAAQACGCAATSPMPVASPPSATAGPASAATPCRSKSIARSTWTRRATPSCRPSPRPGRLMTGLARGNRRSGRSRPCCRGRWRPNSRYSRSRKKRGRDKHGPSLGRKRPRRAYSKQRGRRGDVCCPRRMVHLRRECKRQKRAFNSHAYDLCECVVAVLLFCNAQYLREAGLHNVRKAVKIRTLHAFL